MKAENWLNWVPGGSEVSATGQPGTDRTDKTAVLSVLSVPVQHQALTFGHSDVPEKPATECSWPEAREQDLAETREYSPLGFTSRTRIPAPPQDDNAIAAAHEIASLLADAYLRFAKVRRLTSEISASAVKTELAICVTPSVHGHEHA